MGTNIGIDYGTSMMKAAVVEAAGDVPSLLTLEPPSHLMPSAVEVSADGQFVASGNEAYQHRRRVDRCVAVNFRDRVVLPGEAFLVGGASVDGVQLQAGLLTALAKRIKTNVGETPASVAIAVPDHWSDSAWSLPMALCRAGWTSSLLVREWISVLAMQDPIGPNEALFLSAGSGGTQATMCKVRDGGWHPVVRSQEVSTSGRSLREQVVNDISRSVIQSMRKDPRENAEADQALHDGVEMALRQLCSSEKGQIDIVLFGRPFSQSLSREDVARAAGPLQEPLVRLVKSVLSDEAVKLESCPIIAWGELALLLPLADWLADYSSKRAPLRIAPLDVVAAGTARIAALVEQHGLSWHNTHFCAVSTQDGKVSEDVEGTIASGGFAVLESPPVTLAVPQSSGAPAIILLENGNDGRRIPIATTRLKMGRHPACGLVFDSAQWDSVSGEHAEIARDGTDYILRDLSSANGTYLNEGEVRKAIVLSSGDIIGLGWEGPRLRFEIG